MLEQYEIWVTLIIVVIAFTTYKGLSDTMFKEKYIFHTDAILMGKEYHRMITSGFLHGDWFHFAFNAVALSSFGAFAMYAFGTIGFLFLFFGSMIAGSALSLFVHRNHGDYRALGASGGVFGLLYSTIVVAPFSKLSIMLLPFQFPSWAFGLVLVVLSIIGIKKRIGNIGHDAHLGGAVFGMILTAVLKPSSVSENLWAYALLGVPSIAFIIFIIKNPSYLLVDSMSVKPFLPKSPKLKPKRSEQEELDYLLEKIASKGLGKLTAKEKKRLDELSR